MKINTWVKNFVLIFFILDFILFLYALIFKDYIWLINTQVGFFSSLFITIASFLSYKKNIQSKISNLEYTNTSKFEDRDKIDDIDDPYDLYSEYEQIPEEELTTEKIKEVLKEEKKKVKKHTFKNTIFSMGSFLSLYRIIGYSILIIGFFTLNNNHIFLPIAFIIGISILPLGILISKLFLK